MLKITRKAISGILRQGERKRMFSPPHRIPIRQREHPFVLRRGCVEMKIHSLHYHSDQSSAFAYHE